MTTDHSRSKILQRRGTLVLVLERRVLRLQSCDKWRGRQIQRSCEHRSDDVPKRGKGVEYADRLKYGPLNTIPGKSERGG